MVTEEAEWSSQIDELQRVQDSVQEQGVEVRQYEGYALFTMTAPLRGFLCSRMKGTMYSGENVFVKVFPRTTECDALAVNELKMYDDLQPPHACLLLVP